ncbi:MAG: glycosyltransferase family 4 protein [Chloroflexi bacterium]|nr:glycosyltransferase family 4 protein [Chloroflexota bacterium]
MTDRPKVQAQPPRPLRIAQVNDIASVATTISRALRAAGQDASLLEPWRPGAGIAYPWKLATLPLRLAGIVAAGVELRARRFDLVHVHYARLGMLGPMSGRPYVLHCHGSDMRGVEPGSAWGIEVAPFLHAARRVYYTTPDLEPWVRAFRPDAVFLPNPIELPRRSDAARPPSSIRDVLVGVRLDPIKGVDEVATALRALLSRRPQTTVTVIAQGAGVERIRSLAGDRAVVVPPVDHDDLPALLAAHRTAIGQMRVGAIGNYELEAMAGGLPVAAAFGYPAAYPAPIPIVDGETAEARGIILAALLDDPVACAALGARARAWVAENHGTTAVADRLVADYRVILAAAGQTTG